MREDEFVSAAGSFQGPPPAPGCSGHVNGLIHVAFASDDVGLQGLAVAAYSAVERASRPVHVWVISERVADRDQDRLRTTLSGLPAFAALTFVAHSSLPIRLPSWWAQVRWPLLSAARFQLAEILPVEAHRCIYLDIDVVVGTDIAVLFDLDLRGNPVGMVRNTGMSEQVRAYLAAHGMDAERYCNAGVLLMDLDAWRAEEAGRGLIECGRRMPPDIWFFDQDMLNTYFRNRCELLEERWNYRNAGVTAEGCIQHLAGTPKPWETSAASDSLPIGLREWHRMVQRIGFVPERRRLSSILGAPVKVRWAQIQRKLVRLVWRMRAR